MGVRFIEKITKLPADLSFLMGTDQNGNDGKYSQEALKEFFEEGNSAKIGTLNQLSTTAKNNVVAAINEVKSDIENEVNARGNAIDSLSAASVGGTGKYIESILEESGIIQAIEKSFGSIAKDNAAPVTGGSIYLALLNLASHNVWRLYPKDLTEYYNDGTLWKRLTGTDGFSKYEDIYAGDYFQMSRAITCPDSYDGTQGTSWVTIAEIDGLMYQGYPDYLTGPHLVMVPGKGFTAEANHFGRHRMNSSDTTVGGYWNSEMCQSVIGAVVSAGSTASGASINQQLYAEFGSHLKTTGELLSTAINANGINRIGDSSGCSNSWDWKSCQAVLLSEVEVYGSTVWSSSGYDTGMAKKQFAAFKNPIFQNNRSSYYWLKDVASASRFCYVNYAGGGANYGSASIPHIFVRPRFVLAA